MVNKFNYSVIIPFRNSIDQLRTALRSIPDRSDIQVITIDNSKELFKEEEYPKFKNAHLTITSSKFGAGAGCARNVGLKKVVGDWLLFLDADDFFTKNAFEAFDRYLYKHYDIVFFKADSISLTTGERSERHKGINKIIDNFLLSKDEDDLRYQFSYPVCKMIRSSLILDNEIKFEEIKCANDTMFSVKSGHLASSITADNSSVYVITESPKGGSLTTDKSSENSFIRFQVALRRYAYLKTIGKGYLKPHYYSYILNALFSFGPKEAFRYLSYYYHYKG